MTSIQSAPLPPLPALLIGGIATLFRQRAGVLPDSGLAACFSVAGIDRAHVAKYRKLFGYQGSHVPLGYFYLMAQRAQLALMLDARFPYAIPGLIHTSNGLRRHAAPDANSSFAIDVSVTPIQAAGDVRKIAFAVEISQSGQPVVSCTSEYRIPGQSRNKATRQAEPEKLPTSFGQHNWTYEKSLIRRYAVLSGDYNPIHLSSWLARRLGFREAIAHGMYSVGRAAASIECQTSRPVIAISAEFRRPIPLPARATFGFEPLSATRGSYGVRLAEEPKLALSGFWETGTI